MDQSYYFGCLPYFGIPNILLTSWTWMICNIFQLIYFLIPFLALLATYRYKKYVYCVHVYVYAMCTIMQANFAFTTWFYSDLITLSNEQKQKQHCSIVTSWVQLEILNWWRFQGIHWLVIRKVININTHI